MTHKPNISKNERSAASNRWRHAANIKHGLAIIAFVACILPASNLCGQNIAIKSNLLYDLTTTLNMGGEVRCDDTHTISLSLNYNPWNFGGNKKMKHFLLQPEYRKWFNEVFTGSFIGFQLHYALFNFGGMLPWGFNNGKMLGIENRQIARVDARVRRDARGADDRHLHRHGQLRHGDQRDGRRCRRGDRRCDRPPIEKMKNRTKFFPGPPKAAFFLI